MFKIRCQCRTRARRYRPNSRFGRWLPFLRRQPRHIEPTNVEPVAQHDERIRRQLGASNQTGAGTRSCSSPSTRTWRTGYQRPSGSTNPDGSRKNTTRSPPRSSSSSSILELLVLRGHRAFLVSRPSCRTGAPRQSEGEIERQRHDPLVWPVGSRKPYLLDCSQQTFAEVQRHPSDLAVHPRPCCRAGGRRPRAVSRTGVAGSARR